METFILKLFQKENYHVCVVNTNSITISRNVFIQVRPLSNSISTESQALNTTQGHKCYSYLNPATKCHTGPQAQLSNKLYVDPK